eukprot:g2189.t1
MAGTAAAAAELQAAALRRYQELMVEVTGGDALSWREKPYMESLGVQISGPEPEDGAAMHYYEHVATGSCVWERPATAYCDQEAPALLETDDLVQAHLHAWTAALKVLGTGDEEWLERKTRGEYNAAFAANKAMSNTFCEWLSSELFNSSICRKLGEKSYPASEVDALHELMADFSKLDQRYLEQARGPSKMDVLHTFVEAKMSESVAILTSREEAGNDVQTPAASATALLRGRDDDEIAAVRAQYTAAVQELDSTKAELEQSVVSKMEALARENEETKAQALAEMEAEHRKAMDALTKSLQVSATSAMKAALEARDKEHALAIDVKEQECISAIEQALQTRADEGSLAAEEALTAKEAAHTLELSDATTPVDQEASASGIMEAAKVTTRLYQKQVASKIRGLQNELTATKRQLKRTQSALYQTKQSSNGTSKRVEIGKIANAQRGTDGSAAQGRGASDVEKILSNDLALEREARQSLGRDLEQTELRLKQAAEETQFYRKTASKQIAMLQKQQRDSAVPNYTLAFVVAWGDIAIFQYRQ